jgi:alkanesulfonate monooxygenase SsuD/methylene tetrahydromethanopterin reductase-like flavin-dependent oxidoreductase (luciferase family)
VPPVIVGGLSDAALARAAAHDGWFALPLPPAQLAPVLDRLGEHATALGRPRPAITGSVVVAIDGDAALPHRDDIAARLTDPDGMFGMPAEAVPDILVTGGPAQIADRLAAVAALGAERIVMTLAAGSWDRQAELLAEAVRLLD